MRNFALHRLQQMRKDVEVCMQKNLEQEKQIELCFQICTYYWYLLTRYLALYCFNNDQEEIDFFRNIKPLFTSEINYYNLLYHAELFRPVLGTIEIKRFWCREHQRLEKFIEANAEFCSYYRSGQTCFDEFYFLRRNHEKRKFEDLTELEKKSSSNKDHLLAEYLSLEKYMIYVEKKIENLQNPPQKF